MFYCPLCSGSGQSAAATVGGVIATAVAVCSELESLPLSQKAIKAILRNLIKQPDNPKYRKLRLNNPKVKNLLDLDPCRRILTLIGFSQQKLQNEAILVLQGSVNIHEVQQLLDILDGLSPPSLETPKQSQMRYAGEHEISEAEAQGESADLRTEPDKKRPKKNK
jgi:hypothetical protein